MISKNKYYDIICKLISLRAELDSLDLESIMVDDFEESLEHLSTCIDILVSYMPHIK